MSDRNSPAPAGPRRKGSQQQHYASDSLTQRELANSDNNNSTGKHKQDPPNTPAKKGGHRQHSGPGQQHRGGARNTPDSKRGNNGIPQSDGAADIVAQARTGSITPARAAYAGPTFHASPAASTLPMPSRFFSKSMPSDQPLSGLQSRLDADNGTKSPAPSTAASEKDLEPGMPKPPPREESPLDFFFNAQKAERSGDRNSSPLAFGARAQPPPPAQRRGPAARGTPNPSKNMFMMELDGAGESNEALPDTSSPVPFKERMQAMRTNSSPGHIPTQQDTEAERQAKTMELKKLLSMQSNAFTNGHGYQGQAQQFMPPSTGGGPVPPSQGHANGQQGSPLRSQGADRGSPFASPRGVPPGPHHGHGQAYGGPPHQMQGYPGPYYGSPAGPQHPQPHQGHFPVELPGSAGYTHGSPASAPRAHQGQSQGQQGHAQGQQGPSGIHNQIARMSQMEDSLRKMLKLDDGSGK